MNVMFTRRICPVLLAFMLFCSCAVCRADSDSTMLTLDDKLSAMLPALDSIARALGVDGEVGYAPRDNQFFWTVIYLMGENWGYMDTLCKTVEQDGTTLISIPSQTICDMAYAAFYDYDTLPELIDSGVIQYDAQSGCYLLSHSDVNVTYTDIESYYEQENGNVSLVLGMYSATAERIGGFEFTLVPSNDNYQSTASQYCYRIMSACVQADEPSA